MRYSIDRASIWDEKVAPCEGAVQEGRKWFIEVDDLLGFAEKHGKIIVRAKGILSECPDICIYDDYVE